MSKPRQHDHLAPLLFDFVPKGRTTQDAALYKIMRHMARRNRQQMYDAVTQSWRELFLYGTSTVRLKWEVPCR
jgi:hypothetical protein